MADRNRAPPDGNGRPNRDGRISVGTDAPNVNGSGDGDKPDPHDEQRARVAALDAATAAVKAGNDATEAVLDAFGLTADVRRVRREATAERLPADMTLDELASIEADMEAADAGASAGRDIGGQPHSFPAPIGGDRERKNTAAPNPPPGTGFQTARQLAENPPGPKAWRVDGLIPTQGLVLVTAAPKVGKSTWARSLAAAVSAGRPFMQ